MWSEESGFFNGVNDLGTFWGVWLKKMRTHALGGALASGWRLLPLAVRSNPRDRLREPKAAEFEMLVRATTRTMEC